MRHVFRLLRKAKDSKRPVPWVLLENVSPAHKKAMGDPVALMAWSSRYEVLFIIMIVRVNLS